MSKALIVIPARMASTRFPNKPLASIMGKPMIERVVDIALNVQHAAKVVVATDDSQIAASIEHKVEVVMTSNACKTGTDRVAEAAKQLDDSYDIVFSLQGDAVLTPPWVVDDILKAMLDDASIQIATPATLLSGQAKLDFIESKKAGSSSGTCVVFDKHMNALYFSKGLIPFARDGYTDAPIYRHIGLYGYRKQALDKMNQFKQTPLELIEKLEQLRALENGIPIKIVVVDYKGRTHGSVDTHQDLEVVEQIIQAQGELV